MTMKGKQNSETASKHVPLTLQTLETLRGFHKLPFLRIRTFRKMKNNLTSVKTFERGPWTDDQ